MKTITNTDDTSRQPEDGEFEFTLTGDNGTPMPQGSDGQSKTVTNIGGAFTFGQITYDRPGEYAYHVSEQAGKDKTITYDTRTYDVTVTVTDDGGYLTATSNMDGQTISFDNTYTPTATEASFDVTKLMKGRAFKSGEFTVLLKDEQDNILQSKQINADGKQDENGAYTGEAHFDPITYAKTGLYHYTIVEQAGSEKNGVTYDDTVHNVTVLVEENEEQHKLVAKTNYIAVSPSDKSGQPGVSEKTVRIVNSYKPEGTGFIPCASKKFNGATLQDGEYEFELVDAESGKTLQSAHNTSDGAVTFQPVSYTQTGEHDYAIRRRSYSTRMSNTTVRSIRFTSRSLTIWKATCRSPSPMMGERSLRRS